jgi:hypothetical protein
VNNSGRLDAIGIGNGNMPRTDRLNVGSVLGSQYYSSNQIDNFQDPFDLTTSQPDNGIQAAVYNGFTNASAPALKFGCNTGNCTWPVFTTLGICSGCNDVSQKMTMVDSHPPPYKVFGGTVQGTRTYSLPYVQIANENGTWQYGTYAVVGPPTTGIFLTANTTFNFNDTVSFQGYDTMLMAMAIIKAPEGYINQSQPWEDESPTATECALWVCAKAVQASSTEGELSEKILQTWRQRLPQSWEQQHLKDRGSTYDNKTVPDLSKTTLYQTYDRPRTDLQILVPDSYSPPPSTNNGEFYPPGNLSRQFNISQDTIISTITLLKSWSNPQSPTTGTVQLTYSALMNNPNFYLDLVVTSVLFWSQNLSTPLDNLAQALTNQIRQYGSFPQDGTVQQWVLHFDVTWAFIILPATALVFGCVYVLQVIAETSRLRLPVWKESAFATMANGVEEDVQRELRETEIQGIESSVAQKTIVELVDEGDGLRLRVTS